MRESARRDNYLAFLSLPWAQDASGSNPDLPTKCLELSELEVARPKQAHIQLGGFPYQFKTKG